MDDLTRLLLERDDRRTGQIVYGTATADNTVAVRGAATAVELPALTPVKSGDYCAVWESGADRLILGPVGGVTRGDTGTVSTDGSGDILISHGLGTTPTWASVTSYGSACASWYIRSLSSTQIQVRCYSASGTLLTSTNVQFLWETRN